MRGRRADARGRRQLRQRRDLLLGPARAAAGRVRLRLAGPGDGPAARGRRPGRPGHGDRLAADLDVPAAPGGPAGRPRRAPALARQPADLLPLVPGRTPSCRCGWSSRWPAGTPTIRRWPCGTSATSWATTTCTASATSARRRSGAGCRRGTARATGLDGAQRRRGARRSGASTTRDWADVLPPRRTTTHGNPTQELDFWRFSSDALLATYRRERDLLHRVTPDVPVTTNFMAMTHTRGMDYWAWAPEQDIVTNDHYLDGRLERPARRALLVGRRDAQPGRPQRRRHGRPGHPVAADGALDLGGELAAGQLRQGARASWPETRWPTWPAAPTASRSSSGGPRWPAPRSSTPRWCRTPGTDTKVWREVVELGGLLGRLGRPARHDGHGAGRARLRLAGPVGQSSSAGTRRRSVDYDREGQEWYAAFWDAGHHRGRRRRRTPTSRRTTSSSCRASTPCTDAAAGEHRGGGRGRGPGRRDLLQRDRRRAASTSGSAAIPARSASSSACAPRSSSRWGRTRRSTSTTARPATVWTELTAPRQGATHRCVVRRRAGRRSPRDHPARGRRRCGVVRRDAARPGRPGRLVAAGRAEAARRRGRCWTCRAGRRGRPPPGERPRPFLFVLNHTATGDVLDQGRRPRHAEG